MAGYDKGEKVEWVWGDGTGTGEIVEVFISDVTRTLSGTEVTRHAEPDCPAYLIEQDDGAKVLKSHTEIRNV